MSGRTNGTDSKTQMQRQQRQKEREIHEEDLPGLLAWLSLPPRGPCWRAGDFAAEAAGVEDEGPEAVGPGDTVVPTEGEPEPAEAVAPGERPEAGGGGCDALLGDTCIADTLAALTVSCHAACSAAKRALEISRFAWTRSGEPTSSSSSACACCLASSWRRALAGDTLVGEPKRGTGGGAADDADPDGGDVAADGGGGAAGGRSEGGADASTGIPSTPMCCPIAWSAACPAMF